MHFLIKGIAGKMISLTFDEAHSGRAFNLHHPLNCHTLAHAQRCILHSSPPDRQEWPKSVFDQPHQLKCAEILSFVRLYAVPSLASLPIEVYKVWLSFCSLASSLLYEGEVPCHWIESENGARKDIFDFLSDFQASSLLSNGLSLESRFSCRGFSASASAHQIFTYSCMLPKIFVATRPCQLTGCSLSNGLIKTC